MVSAFSLIGLWASAIRKESLQTGAWFTDASPSNNFASALMPIVHNEKMFAGLNSQTSKNPGAWALSTQLKQTGS
jgi:uncharacterized protein YeaO (DUF488 family)